MTQMELNTAMNNIGKVLKENGANKNGYVVTSTFAIEMVKNEQVMDRITSYNVCYTKLLRIQNTGDFFKPFCS